MKRAAAIVVLGLLSSTAARAHVAPDPDSNNHYIKVTLLADRARVVYTVLFGDRPGAAERRRIDANGDGRIDADEARRFGLQVRTDLSTGLHATVDGRLVVPTWSDPDVGLGTPTVAGGSFSVDLVLSLPFVPDGRTAHQLVLTDDTQLPQAGEAEIRVEESPGVALTASHLVSDAAGATQALFTFRGNPLVGQRAIAVAFTVAPDAPREVAPRASWLPIILVLAVGVGAIVGGAVVVLRRLRHAPPTSNDM